MPALTVTSGEVAIAVFEDGDPALPAVLLVHGYPDTHEVWDKVAGDLATDHHVIRYDVRGAGQSGHPAGRAAYRLDQLAADMFAVIDATSRGRPVHLIGHDWGSIQGWHAATDGRAAGRIATFTTISGPCLDHVAFWFRRRRRHPSPRNLAQLLTQYARSWYIAFFHLPVLAPVAMRLRFSPDAARGIALYRANMLPRLRHPQRRVATLPIQLVVLTRDRYVSSALAGEDLEQWAPDLRRQTLAGNHWSALTDDSPLFCAMMREFIRAST